MSTGATLLNGVRDWLRVTFTQNDNRVWPDPEEQLTYQPYTTSFDREVRIEDVAQFAATDPRSFSNIHKSLLAAFHAGKQRLDDSSMLSEALRSCGDLLNGGDIQFAATILIDQSGSLRDDGKATLSALTADSAARFFLTLGFAVEVLGFTTRSWRGGHSRHSWIAAGKPRYPGRLCDLLHIIYRAADDPSREPPDTIAEVLQPNWLKENVDGEALLWAAQRFRGRPQGARILLVISDGAPVDDSTLMQNGPSYLYRHWEETITAIQASGDLQLGAVGIAYEVPNYPAMIWVQNVDDIQAKLPNFLKSLVEMAAKDCQ
jgi:cobalamin biosynthesis protein CobT